MTTPPPEGSRRAALQARRIEASESHKRAAEELTGLPGTQKLIELIARPPESLTEKEAEFVSGACMGFAGKIVEDALRAGCSLDEIAKGLIMSAQFARKRDPRGTNTKG